MQRKWIGLASIVVFVALGSPALADDAIDVPEYRAWVDWKVGATAVMKTEVAAGGVKMMSTTTVTLKQKGADRLVIEMSTSTEAAGMKFQTEPAPTEIPSKMSKVDPDPKAKETRGKETLTVNGKKLECEWKQVELDGGVTKTWTCKDVPGGVVKETLKSEGQVVTSQIAEWKGEKQ